ncbi:DUF2285 domain-containing protein [Bordetella petrii]|uniref:DUF2285 domain-containing protein n=1 Tax=Bordetella petrii (strain ATCC BAA-461 / DSM 12804 / CCUG 43448 / CIP 107267 / Se-1111R) TaxID=340100 RepID=A9IEV6_BORPD|nr:DUF2285 domain-containing protein [Bordetella petrii]MBO1112133.1 DUF2285 domain-containing protein [Bordetella petrii]CAP44913.1 hypothetical protein Bpet4562 [Bordetella petrii]
MVMTIGAAPWQATAAYLYLLRLDAASLAWEYLRRNADYRACWRRYGRTAAVSVTRPWGLALLEDPQLDARRAHPVWDNRLSALLHIQADDHAAQSGLDLWHIPGPKDVIVLPTGVAALCVRASVPSTTLRARLGPGVLDGRPALCAVPLDTRLHAQAALLTLHAARFAPRRACPVRPIPCAALTAKVDQAHLHHLHALQALDGVQAGASQRRIADVLYGRERMRRDWHADSALRAQVRHSLARAVALMRGGYRDLAGLSPDDLDQ